MTVLTAIAAQISIPLPFTPVPFTFQPMVVLVGAAALGSRLGMTSQMLYLALGIAGLPVFAASPVLPQGAARLLGPTGGYLTEPIRSPRSSPGWLAERGFDRRYLTSVVAMACGPRGGLRRRRVAGSRVVVQPSRGFAGALAAGFTPFIVADLLKLLVAAGCDAGALVAYGRTCASEHQQVTETAGTSSRAISCSPAAARRLDHRLRIDALIRRGPGSAAARRCSPTMPSRPCGLAIARRCCSSAITGSVDIS